MNLDCSYGALIANGFCNDESNTVECGYDGGDCCEYCSSKKYCSECACLGNTTGYGKNSVVGNGICNDDVNHAGCDYDGGDCCLLDTVTEHCSECACSVNGVVTSPGYPAKYFEYLDVIWLIQVAYGNRIEINVLDLDMGSYDCSEIML